MTDAVIVSTARTGLAKSWRGAFNMTHGATLGGHVTQAAVERAKIDPARVEDVIMGCVSQVGEQSTNVARNAVLASRLPVTVPGTLSGKHEDNTALRATLKPCSPTWLTQPMMTSSMASLGTLARATRASITWAARSAGCQPDRRPPLRPPAVRTAATM